MTETKTKWGARFPLVIGFAAVFLLLGGLGAWSVGVQIAGAVVAPGTVQVESERQVIQHPDGGVVGEILARDGDAVEAGDVLIRLDGTFLRSELAIVERQIAELFARGARLEAERDGADALDFGEVPQFALIGTEMIEEQMEGQRALFEARRTSLSQEQKQLAEQQRQIQRQIEGTEAQLSALERQLAIIERELGDVQTLFDQGLIQIQRLLELQREEARLEGEIGRLMAAIAEAETRVSELEIQSLRLVDSRREEAITRLRDLQYSEIELVERRISLMERLARLDIRAPVSGLVFGSRVFAVQSVVQAAEPMLYIVPGDQPLHVTARIDPRDIEQVYPGQDVALMFTTFSQRTTPEVAGVVQRVSADAEADENTGQTFYEAVLVP
ncbi:MAG TPA: HlyD family type I secretion periplasmic adaptor subunit, partial [Myxococcota bacterium]|nr:HlyD family type I secretion periplasmic adaptor subunit [Myxococcota bacterium]